MLRLPVETIVDKDVPISEFIPEITDKKWLEDAILLDNKKVTFYYPEETKMDRQSFKKRGTISKELLCTFKEVTMGDDVLVGYTLLFSEPGKSLIALREKMTKKAYKNLAKIEWVYDADKSLFTRVTSEGTSTFDQDFDNELNLKSNRTSNRSKYTVQKSGVLLPDDVIELRDVSLFAKLAMAHNKPWNKPNYGKGVITKQITSHGGFCKISKKVLAEQQREIIREAEEKDTQNKSETKKDQQSMNMTLKSRRDLINAIQSGRTLNSICNLHIVSLLLLLVLIIMSSVDYAIFNSKYKTIVTNIATFSRSMDLEPQLIQSVNTIRSLILLDSDMLTANNYENYTDSNELKMALAERLMVIQDTIDLTQKEVANLAKDFDSLNSITLSARDLAISYKTTNNVAVGYYNLIESINMINSHIFTIANAAKNGELILEDSNQNIYDDIYFVFTNGLNATFIRLRKVLDVMMEDMEHYTSTALTGFQIILIVAVCIIFLLSLLLIPLLSSIQNTQKEILMLFFKIKRSHAKAFAKQCQQFYNSLQRKRTRQNAGSDSEGSDKDMDSERGNDEDYAMDQDIYEQLAKSGTRKLKQSSMNISSTIFWEIILNVLLSAYFIVNYIVLESMLFSASTSLTSSIKDIGRLNTVHLISYSAIREALYKSDWTIEDTPAYEYSKTLIDNLTAAHDYIENYFGLDKFKIRFYYEDFSSTVDDLFDNSICENERNDYFSNQEDCVKFAAGIGDKVNLL